MRYSIFIGLFLGFFYAPLNAQIRFKDPNGPLHFRINFETAELWKENRLGEWNKLSNLVVENVDKKESFYIVQKSYKLIFIYHFFSLL